MGVEKISSTLGSQHGHSEGLSTIKVNTMTQEFLFVEKYRLQTIEETILPDNLKTTFKEFVKKGELPNLLLSGSAGIGKTTAAKALCREIGADYIVINGSDEGRLIDTLRTKIKNFASTVSLSGGSKVVILDEADYISANQFDQHLEISSKSILQTVDSYLHVITKTEFYQHYILDAL